MAIILRQVTGYVKRWEDMQKLSIVRKASQYLVDHNMAILESS